MNPRTGHIPSISCVIATYNRSNIVGYAINSILAQTYADWELIIVDDQSTDNTWDVIKKYEEKDSRVRCFKNPDKGANFARNLGIEKARGRYIAFLDDDDVSLPHRFDSQFRAISNSGTRFIVSWFEVRDRSNGKLLKVDKKKHTAPEVGFPSRWLIEKRLLREVGGFNPRMVAMQDVELSYRLATKYTFALHPEVVTTMYKTPYSTSSGENAIRGKIQLLEEIGYLMHPSEVASWNFCIALDYYFMRQFECARKHFKIASVYNKNYAFKIAFFYYKCIKFISYKMIINLNIKIFKEFYKYRSVHPIKHRLI